MRHIITDYLSQIINPATRDWYERRLRPLADLPPPEQVTPADIRRIWASIIRRDLSPVSKNQYRRAWRTFWAWMVREGITTAPSPIRIAPLPVGDRAPRHITESEVLRLLDHATSLRDRLIVMVLADTGARLGGLAGVRWRDIDLAQRTMTVVERGSRERTCYLSPLTCAALAAYREEHPTSRSNIWGLGKWGIVTMLRRLGARAGVRRCNPHSFRHGFARSLVSRGVDISQVTGLMGHRDPALTIRFYARWYDRELRDAHRRGSMFSSTSSSGGGDRYDVTS